MAFKLENHKEVVQVQTVQDSSLGIMKWGRNNSFPQTLKNLIAQSPNAKPAVNRTAMFYKGAGFKGEDEIVSSYGLTLKEVVDVLADDLAHYEAFAIQCNYNLKGQVVGINPMRIAELRFNEIDELNYASKVGYFNNFGGNSEIKKTIAETPTKEKIKWFDKFNPNSVLAQIEDTDGGIANYNGQILYFCQTGHSSYPEPRLQAPINYVLSDIENSILVRKETSTGFVDAYLLKTKLSASDPNLIKLEQSIENVQGARGMGGVITMADCSDEELSGTILEKIGNNSGTNTTIDSAGKAYDLNKKVILGAYLIPPILAGADQQNGFSGVDLKDAYFTFNAVTQGGRDNIESALNRVLQASVFKTKEIKIEKLKLDLDEELEGNDDVEDTESDSKDSKTKTEDNSKEKKVNPKKEVKTKEKEDKDV